MPISETVIFTVPFGLAIIFTVFGLFMQKGEKTRLTTKIIAGLCWIILALSMFAVADFAGTLTIPFIWLCIGLGIFMWLTTLLDWRGDKKDRWAKGLDG